MNIGDPWKRWGNNTVPSLPQRRLRARACKRHRDPRPKRRLRSLATAKLYQINDKQALFLPQFQNHQDFYLELDNRILIEEMKTELSYITRHWDNQGSPVQALLINPAMDTAALI